MKNKTLLAILNASFEKRIPDKMTGYDVVLFDLNGMRISKTEIIAHALSALGNPSKNGTVMVGDREHDIIGAQGNAIDSIAVTYGYGSLSELQRVSPTYLAYAVEDIGALTG